MIDLDRIVQATVAVGFEHLTMKAVAEHLGVTHAALYNHVRNRDDLVKTVIRTVFRDVGLLNVPPTWRDYLAQVVWEILGILDRHPGLANLMIDHGDVHPVVVRFSDIAVTLLDAYGFWPAEAIFAVDLLHDFTDTPLLFELQFNALVSTDDGPKTLRAVGMAPWVNTLDPRLQPAMMQVLNGDPQDWLAVKLQALLDGIERGLQRMRDGDQA